MHSSQNADNNNNPLCLVELETNIDECASNPCENEGRCKDVVGGYECDCLSEFQGHRVRQAYLAVHPVLVKMAAFAMMG